MNHVEVCWFFAEVDIVALGESVLASLRCMAWFPCSLPKKDARPSLKFFEAKDAKFLGFPSSLLLKAYPLPQPTLIFDDFWCSTPSLSAFWAFWAFWASFTRWTSTGHPADSLRCGWTVTFPATTHSSWRSWKTIWKSENCSDLMRWLCCGNMGARNQPTNLFQFIYIDT